MNKEYRGIIHCAALLLLGFMFSACGGSSGSTNTGTTVSGVVMAGPASGTKVKVKSVLGNYSTTSAPTNSNGAFQVTLPDSVLSGDLIFEASGGTFPDEATAAAGVTLGTLSAHVTAGTLAAGANVTIDPASTIICELVKAGKTKTVALTDFAAAFGYTPDGTIKPVFAGISSAATTAQRLAGLRAAAFSQLAKDLGIIPAKQHELILALAEDLADGTLDGLKTGGAAVTTASAILIPTDIANRFSNALMTFQMDTSLNKSKLTPDKIGAPLFVKKALTDSYLVEYLPGTMAAATGKTMFKIKLTNRSDGTAASGKTVTLRPYMYMAAKSHSTPMEAVTDNGDGTYSCTVYYVMSSAMNGISMGVWELKVTVDGTESTRFFPVVGMPMGSTTLAKLNGVGDSIMGMAGLEKRTWFLFNDGLSGMSGSNTFKLFLATKEMGTMLTFPAVRISDTLLDQNGTPWTVTSIVVEASTDKTTWTPATDAGNGHWSTAGLTGLTVGTAGKIYVRLTVNSELKTTDGLALAADGSNGYQTFTVTPM